MLETTKTKKNTAIVAVKSVKKAHHGTTPANPLLVVDTLGVVDSAGDWYSSGSRASVTIVTPGNRRLSSRFCNSAENLISLAWDGL